MLDGPLASQTMLMWVNGFIAVVWFICAISAFTAWRAFKQTADLRWLFGYLLLGLFAVGEALSARSWLAAAEVGGLPQMTLEAAADTGSFDIRFTVLHLVAALVVLFAFRTRRVSFE